MDNKNNNTQSFDGKFTCPAPDGGASVQDMTPDYSQGKYPQPPDWTRNIVVSDKPWVSQGDEGNVSVEFNEPEKETKEPEKEKFFPEKELAPKKEWPMWVQILLLVVIAIIAVFAVRYALNAKKAHDDPTTLPTTVPTMVTEYASAVSTTVPTMPEDDNNTKKEEKVTDSEKEEKTTAADKDKDKDKDKPSSNAEKKNDGEAKKKIVQYFNESSNRVKTDAVKVVKNFEKRTHNEDKLNLPSAIKAVGKNLLESKITDITEPVEYATPEAIVAKYPVPGAEWSSKLTEKDVAEATCVEKGGEYEITLVLNDYVDPEPGKGPSKAMDCLDVPTVRDTAPPFITAFSAEYYDCVIRCRIDKATGRVVWSNYTTPVLLKVGLDAGFVDFDAEIGLTFEKDYSITY